LENLLISRPQGQNQRVEGPRAYDLASRDPVYLGPCQCQHQRLGASALPIATAVPPQMINFGGQTTMEISNPNSASHNIGRPMMPVQL